MKKSLLTLLVLMLFGSVYAQEYTSYYRNLDIWEKDQHAGTATFVGKIYINDVPNSSTAIELGAYDMADPDHIAVTGAVFPIMESNGVVYDYPMYFISIGGETGDRIIFRIYDHESQTELEYMCAEEYIWEDNGGDVTGTWIWHFFTAKEMHFAGLVDNDWSNAENWTADGEAIGRLPYAGEDVFIDANCVVNEEAAANTVTVTSGATLTIGDEGFLTAELTIKDGGQFFAPAGSEYAGIIEKEILGYGNTSLNNYYFLSIPVSDFDNISGFEAAGMLFGNYDLYFFQSTADDNGPVDPEDGDTWWCGEWKNYKFYMNEESGYEATDFASPYNSYLYANQETTTLSFNGSFFTAANKKTSLSINSGADWGTFVLIGNPYPSNALLTKGNKVSGYYMINEENNRTDVIAVDGTSTIVAPATAVFAELLTGNPPAQRYVQFEPSDQDAIVRGTNESHITIEVLENGTLQDRAYVRMYESENLSKFSLNKEGTKIFIPQNGKNYAAVYAGEAKVMPLCFTTTEGGIYTLSINAENMDCNYLHLIDNVTGADVDLLRTSTYSFNSNDGNYATRFKLVFAEEATNEIAESFAFISNGELMINNYGEATLQVMDITGRILSTENIQNCYSKSLNLSAGVYVVRLTNGVDVKTQKIVVE